ncbi:MAG: hypothetical protein ACLFRX_01340 [Gemmatimonadota bacterium]
MRSARRLLGLALVPLLACGEGEAGDEALELEPGPATRGVPGAAGSITLDKWDTDLDGQLSRDEFDAWWAEHGPLPVPDTTDVDEQPVADELAEGFQRHDIVGRVDVDADQTTDDKELRDWWFDFLDRNDDGRIDATEWSTMHGS